MMMIIAIATLVLMITILKGTSNFREPAPAGLGRVNCIGPSMSLARVNRGFQGVGFYVSGYRVQGFRV